MVGKRREIDVEPIEGLSGDHLVSHREGLLPWSTSQLEIAFPVGRMNGV